MPESRCEVQALNLFLHLHRGLPCRPLSFSSINVRQNLKPLTRSCLCSRCIKCARDGVNTPSSSISEHKRANFQKNFIGPWGGGHWKLSNGFTVFAHRIIVQTHQAYKLYCAFESNCISQIMGSPNGKQGLRSTRLSARHYLQTLWLWLMTYYN